MLSAFALALLGGMHCAGMCGGFVIALHGVTPNSREAVRFALAYHGGRLTSYATGGALVGLLGAQLYASRVLPVQIGLLVVGAAMLLAIGASMWQRPAALNRIGHLGSGIWRLLEPLARGRFPPKTIRGALVTGLAWGWIPCGMVYAALPLALVAGSPLKGAAVMLAFGLGTMPNPTALRVGAARRRRASGNAPRYAWLRPALGVAMLLFAVSDLAHAAQMAGWQSTSLVWLASICHS
jgi:sulfite exporter TauE/SafE